MNQQISSTLQLLRFHFSIFLMPVYWFAISQLININRPRAILVFIILHALVYPASNGYNSYMDRDTTSIGGVKKPKQPTKLLFYVTIILDCIAILLSLLISTFFALGILLYILASRAYSYRGIRLKKYPVTGYLTVMIFQGAVTFLLVYHGCSASFTTEAPMAGMIASSLLIGGFYPLTQVYQHKEDLKDGVKTISYLLGYNGTFIFTGIIYAMSFIAMGYLFFSNLEGKLFYLFQIFMLPVLVYFFTWFRKVAKDNREANFENTMRMNVIASVCTNLGFITILILRLVE